MSSTGIPSIQGSDSKTSMAAVTATTPPRTRLWPVAAASGVILAGQVMVYWGILKTTLLNEQIAMLFLGCAGAGAAIVGMVVEQIKPEIMAMPLIKGLLGVSVFLSGLATMLTIVFGRLETVISVVAAIGLTGTGALVLSELQQFDSAKARAVGASDKARNGKYGIGLVAACFLNMVVCSYNYHSNNELAASLEELTGAGGMSRDLQLTSVVFSVPMLIGSAAGLIIGGALGSKEKYAYLGLCSLLVLCCTLFPLSTVAGSKSISMSTALISALFCSATITKNLFNHSV